MRANTRLAFLCILIVGGTFTSLPTIGRGQEILVSYGNSILQYSLSGTAQNVPFITGLNNPEAMAAWNGNLYVVNNGNGTIGEYNLATGATINAALVSGLSDPYGIAVSGGNIFVANRGAGAVGEYDATSGATINAALINTSPFRVDAVAISGSDLFISTGNKIGEYTTSGTTINADLASDTYGPRGIAIVGNDVFVVNQTVESVSEFTTSGATIGNPLAGLPASAPAGIAAWGGDLFVTLGGFGGVVELDTSGASLADPYGSIPGGFGILVVPEPSSIALMGLGAAAIAAVGRRRMRTRAA